MSKRITEHNNKVMYHSIAVANYFLKKSFETGIEVTMMKLIKLVYIAHGWYRGITGTDLLEEPAQAWKYGPVIGTIYHEFKEFGNNPITKLGRVLESEGGNVKVFTPEIDDEEVTKFLDKVWEIYSGYTALELSTLTHQRNTPWDIIYNHRGGKNIHHTIIPNSLIEEHYKEKLDESRRRIKEG